MGKIGRNSVLRRFWPHECGAQKLPSHIAAPPKICQLYPSLAGMDPRGVLGDAHLPKQDLGGAWAV